MSVADEGAQLFESGRPPMDKLCGCREDERCDSCTPDSEILFYQSQPWPRVFLSSGPPPPADVLALVDRKGGYWPRVGPDCWNCPGNEPHAWSEMVGPFVEAPRLPTADDVAAALAADEAWRCGDNDSY